MKRFMCVLGLIPILSACEVLDESGDKAELHYALGTADASQCGIGPSDAPNLVSACDFTNSDSILHVEVLASPQLIPDCSNGVPAQLHRHYKVPVTVVERLGGKATPGRLSLTISANGLVVPAVGAELLVSVIDAQGSYLVGGLVFVSVDQEFVESRVADDRAIDLPTSRKDLRFLLAGAIGAPANVCSADELLRKLTKSDMIDHFNRHDGNPCDSMVHEDNEIPHNSGDDR